jgi:CDP-diacylglycerol--glycerol-3-phosphate 3-phosphatidyltransferase
MIVLFSLSFIPESSSFAPLLGTSGFNWIDLTCAIIFVLGSITDSIDGKIARKHNLITDLGKFLDPLADKFLVDSAFILLSTRMTLDGHFYLYPFLTVLFVGRDLAMDGLRMVANSKGRVLAANIYGKVKTVMEMIVIPVIFLNGFPFNYLDCQGRGDFAYTYVITNVLAGLALLMSLISCVIYFIQNKDVLKEEKK